MLAAFDELLDASDAVIAERLTALRSSDPVAAETLGRWLAADRAELGIVDDPVHFSALLIDAEEELTQDEVSGTNVGAYRLLREIGRGGMGAVWLAERADGQFQQHAALKLIKRGMDSDAVLSRFRAERQILARLEHPNIAHLLDGGIAANGQPFFVMEYVDGVPLLDYARRNKLDLRACLILFRKLCSAVAYAHSRLIVHRDLKPANVLVTHQGEPKLLDFGIAKLLGDEAAEATGTGQRVFTPAYAAPEQLAGEPISTATDVYALGLVLFELFTGQPIARDGMLRARTTERPSTVRARAGELAPTTIVPAELRGDVDLIVLKALARDPTRRYASADALADDIERYLDGRPITARPDTLGYRTRKFLQRHRIAVAAALLVVLALAGGLSGALWQAQRANAAAARAEAVKGFLVELFRASDPNEARGRTLTARDLLDQGARRLDADASIEPSMRAELLGLIGEIHLKLGDWPKAEVHLMKAEQTASVAHGGGSREHARAMTTLGRLRVAQGRYAEARQFFEDAAAAQQRLGAVADSDRAVTLRHRATLANNTGKFDEGLRLANEAVALAETTAGRASQAYIDALSALANARHWRNEYAESVPVYRQMLDSARSTFGDMHPRTIDALHALGAILSDTGFYAEATPLLRQAMAAASEVFGPQHVTTLGGASELAFALLNQASVAEAEALLRSALNDARVLLGSEHPNVGYANIYLMYALASRGHLGEAEAAGREAIRIYSKAIGVHASYALRSKAGLADVLRDQGRAEEAATLLREVLGPSVQHEGEQGIHVALVRSKLALAALELGQIETAESLMSESRDLLEKRLGEHHDFTWEAERAVAGIELARGRRADAEARLGAQLGRVEKQYGAADFRTGLARWRYAQAIDDPSRRAAIEQQALPILGADPSADHPLAVMARGRLAGVASSTSRRSR